MNDGELQIPSIAPIGAGVARPRWSVMIPAYNAAATICETLETVLHQAPAPSEMQIAVVDNSSTDETIAAVERISAEHGGRVEIHRHSSNLGLVANWNACIERARGELVHLLHADDFVRAGFFATVQSVLEQHTQADMCLVRSLVVDAYGEPVRLAQRLGRTGEALAVSELAYGNEFYCPGVVVRRDCYERLGGYSPVLAYVHDWEMWLRILSRGEGIYVNEPLACYREAAGSVTTRFSRTADDLRELIHFSALIQQRVPGFVPLRWRMFLKQHAVWAMANWERAGDAAAYEANRRYWRQFATTGEKLDVVLAKAKAFGKECERPLRKIARHLRSRSK